MIPLNLYPTKCFFKITFQMLFLSHSNYYMSFINLITFIYFSNECAFVPNIKMGVQDG